MRRTAIVAFVLAGACARASGPGGQEPTLPLTFRALSEGQNAAFCVSGPEFAVAMNEAAWIDVFDRQTDCRPSGEVELPDVKFDTEFGIAAWWKVVGCLGSTVRTRAVQLRQTNRAEIFVIADATEPSPGAACATARAGLESFLAVKRSTLLTGKEPVAFVLDGKVVARVEAAQGTR